MTREELRRHLWPDNTFVDFDLALKRVVNRLRDPLGDSAENPRFIETISRLGYRFIAPVSASSAEPHEVELPPTTPFVPDSRARPTRLLITQSHHWVDQGSSSCWQIARERRDDQEYNGCAGEGERIGWSESEQHVGD